MKRKRKTVWAYLLNPMIPPDIAPGEFSMLDYW